MWLALLQVALAPSAPTPACDSLLGVTSSRIVDSLGGFDICVPGKYRLRTYPTGHLWDGPGRHPLITVQVDTVAPPTMQSRAESLQAFTRNDGRCFDCTTTDSLTFFEDSTGPMRYRIETAFLSGGYSGLSRAPVFSLVAARSEKAWVVITVLGLSAESRDMVDRIGNSVRWIRSSQ